MIRAGGCASPIKVGSGLVGLHLKSALLRVFIVSRNWLTLGGAVPPAQQGPGHQCAKCGKYRGLAKPHEEHPQWERGAAEKSTGETEKWRENQGDVTKAEGGEGTRRK